MEPRVEVKSVSFPNSISGSIFELRTLGSARTIKFSKREYLDLNSAADLPVSFKPQVPHHLSGGFVVQNAQLNNGRFRSIAVRITDGLVKGTVYECSPADAPEMKIQSASRISTADIVFTLVMDAPGDLRDRILKAFAKSGRPNRGPGNSRPGTAPPPQDVVTSGNGAQRRVARSAPIPPKIDHP
jgi:hypothetical protein